MGASGMIVLRWVLAIDIVACLRMDLRCTALMDLLMRAPMKSVARSSWLTGGGVERRVW